MSTAAALVTGLVAVTVGLLVILRSEQERIGWLLVAHGVCFAALLAQPGAGTSHAGMVVDQLAAGSWVFLFLWLALVAYLVPDGHALSPAWRRWMVGGLVAVAAFLVGSVGDADGFRETHESADPPLRWLPGPVAGALGVVGLVGTVLLVFGAVIAVRSRLRRSSGDTRLQLLWLVWGATSLPLALLLAWVGHLVLDDNAAVVGAALALGGAALPVTIGIAVLRHQLFDVRLVLSRTLTYGVLLTAVLTVYAGLLVGAQHLVGGSGLGGGLVAVALVAVGVHPAYSVVRRRIERWVYGYRSDPAAALRSLGARLDSADPLHVVEAVLASVREALNVESVWLAPAGADEGSRLGPEAVRAPLVHRGEPVGELVVEVPRGRRLSPADLALLHDLARLAAVTVRAAQLAVELQTSRSRIVTAREEERKRLRRELHDGVGPSLAAIQLKVEAARLRADPQARDALLVEVQSEAKTAIAEVRRAVDELRPPAIDEVGLSGALRQRAASLSTDVLVFRVHGPSSPPAIPAAVEVAAFRIASEAMTNVARHSRASRCQVELVFDHVLEVTVSDDGQGVGDLLDASSRSSGLGWSTMTERAAEVGGSCTISGRAQGGLVVHAVLPLTTDHQNETAAAEAGT